MKDGLDMHACLLKTVNSDYNGFVHGCTLTKTAREIHVPIHLHPEWDPNAFFKYGNRVLVWVRQKTPNAESNEGHTNGVLNLHCDVSL